MSEAAIQRAVMEHLAKRGTRGAFAFHVPNGGYRTITEAKRLKAQGVKAGVPDIVIVHRGQFYGLELKTEKGRLSDMQMLVQSCLELAGAEVFTAYGLNEALTALERWGLLQGAM